MFWIDTITATIAIVATAVIFGTDTLTALVSRAAFAEIDDRALVQFTGRSHRYGDRRLSVVGVLSVVFSVATVGLAVLAQSVPAAVVASIVVVSLAVWLMLFARISAPINKRLTAAALADEVPADARALQERWESIIVLRSVLQGVAVVGLCVALALIAAA
ncbi:DUF1772 domain-containing protein [Agromyces intestinalis]|uniref:DUF1772 domain-containing protein n=1 Tax=Agromyces intestinalis TaxID=2592652 RepID=A0A5C1YEM6_9MICO|nr:DUF1772 domain-containing protein [Agromyces intestinalis]QEO14138.1 DUF1772 domain-containing protein [Agromyces intestinalis]